MINDQKVSANKNDNKLVNVNKMVVATSTLVGSNDLME